MTIPPLALLAVLLLAVPSKGPAPAPAKAAQDNQSKGAPKQNQPESNQQPASPMPAGIDKGKAATTLGNEKQPCKAEKDNSPEQGWPKITAILVAVFTGALAALAIVQAHAMRKQAEYMRDGLTETTKAANAASSAANTAARALEMLERPEVLVVDVSSTKHVVLSRLPDTSSILVTFANTGRSRAIGFEYTCALRIVTNDVPDLVSQIEGGPVVIAVGGKVVGEFPPLGKILENADQRILAGIAGKYSEFIIKCELRYADIFDKEHQTSAVSSFTFRSDGRFLVNNCKAT